jgi:hypothetical protein
MVAFAVLAFVAAGFALTRGGDGDDKKAATAAPRKLNLVNPNAGERFASSDGVGGPTTTWPRDQYQLDGTLADLGSTGTVYSLGGSDLTDADVATMARALGLSTTPTPTGSGWSLGDADQYFEVYTIDGVGVASVNYSAAGQGFSSPGYPGEGSDPTGTMAPNEATAEPSPPVRCDDHEDCPPPPTTYPPESPATTLYPPEATLAPPADLPDESRAERIARDLLSAMGVPDLNWSAVLGDNSVMSSSVGCAVTGAPTTTTCPQPPPPVMRSRQVTLTATIDGQRVDAVGWRVSVGDGGAIEDVSGTWGRPVAIADYPLRSTADVFADLQAGTAFELGGSYARRFEAVGAAIAEDSTVSPAPSTIVPQPYVVTITGVERGLGAVEGIEDGRRVTYLVPTYHYTVSDGGYVEVVAIDPSLFGAVTPPEQVEPQPAPDPVFPDVSSSPGVPERGYATVAPSESVPAGPAGDPSMSSVPTTYPVPTSVVTGR